MTRLSTSAIPCFALIGLGTASWPQTDVLMLRQWDSEATVLESTILDMVFRGEIIHDVAAGAVNVSDAAFTNVVLGVVFAIIFIEDGEGRIGKSPRPKQISIC